MTWSNYIHNPTKVKRYGVRCGNLTRQGFKSAAEAKSWITRSKPSSWPNCSTYEIYSYETLDYLEP